MRLIVAMLVTLSLEFVGTFGARSVMETLVVLGAKSKVSLARELPESLKMFDALVATVVVSAAEFVSLRVATTDTTTPIAKNKKKFQEIIIRAS